MTSLLELRPELIFGAPECDKILPGNSFSVGFAKGQRHAKWTIEKLECREKGQANVHTLAGTFRTDTPECGKHGPGFAAIGLDPDVHDEGDITQASLDVLSPDIFLLPHMSLRLQPTWQNLENATRALVQKSHIRQVFVLNAPVSYFELNDVRNMTAIYQTGDDDLIPQGFIKSVLAQDMDGAFYLWTFELLNTTLDGALCDYLVSTYDAEALVGGRLWDRIYGGDLHDMKRTSLKMWDWEVDLDVELGSADADDFADFLTANHSGFQVG